MSGKTNSVTLPCPPIRMPASSSIAPAPAAPAPPVFFTSAERKQRDRRSNCKSGVEKDQQDLSCSRGHAGASLRRCRSATEPARPAHPALCLQETPTPTNCKQDDRSRGLTGLPSSKVPSVKGSSCCNRAKPHPPDAVAPPPLAGLPLLPSPLLSAAAATAAAFFLAASCNHATTPSHTPLSVGVSFRTGQDRPNRQAGAFHWTSATTDLAGRTQRGLQIFVHLLGAS